MRKTRIRRKKQPVAPAYMFGMTGGGGGGMDAISMAGNAVGGIIENNSSPASGGMIAGKAIKGAAMGASVGSIVPGVGTAIGGALGAAGGTLMGFAQKKKILAEQEEAKQRKIGRVGMANTAALQQQHGEDYTQAYTFANGGVLPNVAFLDNNEVVRDNGGNIGQVPDTRRGTDQHLVDSSGLESVLSDKVKIPGTKITFADAGNKIIRKSRLSKGKDRFAEQTNELNKRNANMQYNQLLSLQEAVKEAKGVQPKTKSIDSTQVPAYVDGVKKRLFNIPDRSSMIRQFNPGYPDPIVDENATTIANFSERFRERLNRKNEAASDPSAAYSRWMESMNPEVTQGKPYLETRATGGSAKTLFGGPKPHPNQGRVDAYNKSLESSGTTNEAVLQTQNPTGGSYYRGIRDNEDMTGVFNPDSYRFSASGTPGKTSGWNYDSSYRLGDPMKKDDEEIIPPIDTKSKEKVPAGGGIRPSAAPIEAPQSTAQFTPPVAPKGMNQPLSGAPAPLAGPDVAKMDTSDLKSAGADMSQPRPGDPVSGGGNKFDWQGMTGKLAELAPTMYNFFQGLKKPEVEEAQWNPYTSAIQRTMARRRYNPNEAINMNRRTRSISNYNAGNLSPNTGRNMAFRTQLAQDERANNMNIYAQAQNVNNQYMGEYANMMNNLGQQHMADYATTREMNRANRATPRNHMAAAASQIGQWAQVKNQERNQRAVQERMMPFMKDFLRGGFSSQVMAGF